MAWLVRLFAAASLFALGAHPALARPFLFHRGILNAASFAPQGLPNGSIARGSIFTLFGRDIGPATAVSELTFPLATTLGGVSVEVWHNNGSVAASPLFVSAGQINAIMPSNTPIGSVAIRVVYNGEPGNYSPARVVASSLGIFAANSAGFGPGILFNFIAQGNEPLNSAVAAARPGQVVTLWGTGLGAGLNPDNVMPQAGNLPTEVDIFVGGKRVTNRLYSGRSPCCAGLDQIVFALPADAPTGCYVPVQVRTDRTVTSNTVSIAVDAAGANCRDDSNPLQPQFLPGGALAIVAFERSRTLLDLFQPDPAIEVDSLAAYVAARRESASTLFYNSLLSLPPLGACATWSVRGNYLPGLGATVGPLDAGAPLQVGGASGAAFVQLPSLPDLRLSDLTPDNIAAQLSLSSPGGQDIGPFNAAVSSSEAFTWTNRAQIVEIDRGAALHITWTTQAGTASIAIAGGNYDPASDAAGMFVCRAAAEAQSFDVPPEILSIVPPSPSSQPTPTGQLFLTATPQGGVSQFQATGLDRGLIMFLSTWGKTVRFR